MWRSVGAARVGHALTAAVVLAALVLQTVLVVRDGTAPMGTRLVNLVSYFTIQSNLLVAFAATTLALAPRRDGRVWRVVRLDALLGITVTGVVYVTVLAPLHDLSGAPAVADAGLHYVSPVLAVLVWWLYGPRRRVDRSTVLWAMVWPLVYFAYTLGHGAVSGWYPYPFLDVTSQGYAVVLRSSVLVTLLLGGVAAAYWWGDIERPEAPRRSPVPVGRWSVTAVDGGPVDGPEIELAADGSVSGSTGVNRIAGTYRLTGPTLVMGPLATTRMAGPPEAMQVEDRLLALLSDELTAVEDGDGWTLTGPSGSLRLGLVLP